MVVSTALLMQKSQVRSLPPQPNLKRNHKMTNIQAQNLHAFVQANKEKTHAYVIMMMDDTGGVHMHTEAPSQVEPGYMLITLLAHLVRVINPEQIKPPSHLTPVS